jgi:hypothetical protein
VFRSVPVDLLSSEMSELGGMDKSERLSMRE